MILFSKLANSLVCWCETLIVLIRAGSLSRNASACSLYVLTTISMGYNRSSWQASFMCTSIYRTGHKNHGMDLIRKQENGLRLLFLNGLKAFDQKNRRLRARTKPQKISTKFLSVRWIIRKKIQLPTRSAKLAILAPMLKLKESEILAQIPLHGTALSTAE